MYKCHYFLALRVGISDFICAPLTQMKMDKDPVIYKERVSLPYPWEITICLSTIYFIRHNLGTSEARCLCGSTYEKDVPVSGSAPLLCGSSVLPAKPDPTELFNWHLIWKTDLELDGVTK